MRVAAITGAAGSIRVSAVGLGCVDTAVTGRAVAELPDAEANGAWVDGACIFGLSARPEEIAGVIVFLLADAASFVTDTVSIVGRGGLCER